MDAMEKIRDVPISTTPIAGTNTECQRLIIPTTVVDKLNIKPTKTSGVKCVLYIRPPLDKIKPGDAFELIYSHPGCKVNVEGNFEVDENEGVEK